MSIIYFDPSAVRLKKFAASTTSGPKKTTSVVRIELVSSDPYAIASVISSLEEIDREQRAADEFARRAAKPAPRAKSLRIAGAKSPLRIPSAEPVMLLPYLGDDK